MYRTNNQFLIFKQNLINSMIHNMYYVNTKYPISSTSINIPNVECIYRKELKKLMEQIESAVRVFGT